MAAPARITSLNLGTQTVGLAEFQRAENGGVMLNAYKLTEIHSAIPAPRRPACPRPGWPSRK